MRDDAVALVHLVRVDAVGRIAVNEVETGTVESSTNLVKSLQMMEEGGSSLPFIRASRARLASKVSRSSFRFIMFVTAEQDSPPAIALRTSGSPPLDPIRNL
jgi:hypothetical protein